MSKSEQAKQEVAKALHDLVFWQDADIRIERKTGYSILRSNSTEDAIKELLNDKTIVKLTIEFKPDFEY